MPKRKLTACSHKHSFTPYPSLSPYWRTELRTEERIHSLHVGWRNFFSSYVCQFVVLAGNRFWFYILMYLEYKYSCGVVLVFWFWREIVFGVTYVLSVQYCCAVHHLPARIYGIFGGKKISFFLFRRNLRTLRKHYKKLGNWVIWWWSGRWPPFAGIANVS